MTELDKLQRAFMKADALAQSGDAQAKADAQMFAREIRRIQADPQSGQQSEGFMANVNAGIANSVGGLVDFVNPFDDPAWAQYGAQTGSAKDGLKSGMKAIDASVADGPATGIVDSMARGAGEAAGALLPVAGASRLLQQVAGITGRIGTSVYNSLASKSGAAAEMTAGGISGGAQETVKQSGGPEWAQQTAGIISPMAIPLASVAARLAAKGAEAAPLSGAAIRAVKGVVKAVAPMSREGAMQVAKDRVQSLAGGSDRADELARQISNKDDLGRTPAQQTGDPNLLGLEQAAARENPVLRESLDAQRAVSVGKAAEAVKGPPGLTANAKAYFAKRFQAFKTGMKTKIDTALQMGDETLEAAGPRASETTNSLSVVKALKTELDTALYEEGSLWKAVPKDARVKTDKAAAAVKTVLSETAWAQSGDVPPLLKGAFGPDGALGEATTVAEMHGLYSEMRRVARSAMAGNDQNKNRARIANDVAEAILADLGAIGGETPAGRAINTAREFSRALHETFDQGAVGRILKRTIDGDEAVAPETALARTVGRGGAAGIADADKITTAAPKAIEGIDDYLRGRFLDSAFAADGTFSPKRGADWLRTNREMLNKQPGLQAEFSKALRNRNAAHVLSERTTARIKGAESGSAISKFSASADEKAVLSVIGANEPVSAARSIVATARKDQSGKALAGVKAGFSNYLIGKAGTADGLSGEKLTAILQDPATNGAMRQVYSGDEFSRLQRIAKSLTQMDAPAADVGGVISAPPNFLVDYLVRTTAARIGGGAGGGSMGGSLQTANIAVGRAKKILDRLTNDRARQLLMDAVQDPELFKMLLQSPQALADTPKLQAAIAPYLTGGAAALVGDAPNDKKPPNPDYEALRGRYK